MQVQEAWAGFYTSIGHTSGKTNVVVVPATKNNPERDLSVFFRKLTHRPKIVGVFRPPLSPSPHNLRSILELKQVLALDSPRSSQMAYVCIRDRCQGLQHAVLPTLPPILQSHWSELIALQDRQRGTLQEKAPNFIKRDINNLLIKYIHYVLKQKFHKQRPHNVFEFLVLGFYN